MLVVIILFAIFIYVIFEAITRINNNRSEQIDKLIEELKKIREVLEKNNNI